MANKEGKNTIQITLYRDWRMETQYLKENKYLNALIQEEILLLEREC